MNVALSKRLRLLASVVSVLVLLAALAAGWFYFRLRASLPQLDGAHALAGLSAPATIRRDDLGVPTIRGATRADVARALGFAHAQDRFFQMDLLRRRPAGELAELFGRVALPMDRAAKPHRFRALARTVLARLPAADRSLLEAYTAGVNAGLAALGAKPFEYFVLRTTPVPWRVEDSVLICYAMTLDLQDATNAFERSLSVLRDHLGTDAVAFFAPTITPDDAAIDGTTARLPPIPGPATLDLRTQKVATAAQPAPLPDDEGLFPGSNSFALAGRHTANGAALLANDPHLNLGIPNIWYRAALEWPAAGPQNPEPGTPNPEPRPALHRIVGVSLPGLPFIILGSNGHVAWGMTVAYADTNDLVAIDVNPVSHNLYKVPGRDDLLEIETHRDTIAVKGGEPETVETRWTFWGPIIATDNRERPLAHHWVAYDPAATNLNFMRLESAEDVAEAVAIAHDAGVPAHNFLVADRSGAIAWTIVGKVPKRVGFDGRLPVSWGFGDRRWDGFLSSAEMPTVVNPPGGRLFTANNRVIGGAALATLGDGGYALPARAAQIRDDLAPLEHATPRDLLAIQLDDRALFLARWQKLLLATLTPEAVAGNKSRVELRRLAEHWEGRASIDSVSYRLVRAFRAATAELALMPVFASCLEAMPDFDWRHFNYEPALWILLHEKPAHLLAPTYASWDALLLAAADKVVADLDRQGVALDRATWGARNTAKIQHPFGAILPLGLGRWLNMPAEPLPGDVNMPRLQGPAFGASMRLVVSPGHEDEALLHMPGGASGHPLSPFYRAGHEAWAHGTPTPLLPGAPRHTLTLQP